MTVAGIVALAGLAVVVASLAYLHLAPTGLSPVRNPVSQYGITPYKAGYRVATIAFAAAGAALAIGIDQAIKARGSTTVVALLLVFAAARAVISWFPMDTPGTPRTSTGQVHGVLAIVAFGAATVAAFRLAVVLDRSETWHGLGPVSLVLGIAMAASIVGMMLARSNPAVRARFGAVERGFYVSAIAWFAVFSVACAGNPR